MTKERAALADKLSRFESKREEWGHSTAKLEDYFNKQLETIRSNFDLQLRDLIDKQRVEINMLEGAL